MKCKLIMLLAILLLSFGLANAADSVAVWIYDVANDVVMDPATDTIYTEDVDGNPLSYQIWIGLESDVDLYGMSLGFRMWSNDGVQWQYDAQTGGLGVSEAVTVVAGSRMDPPSSAFDMTGLLVNEKNMDGMLDDTVTVGGVSLSQTLELGPMEPMMAIHFTPAPVGFYDSKTFCVDSAFVPPAGAWVYTDIAALTFPPKIGPAVCFPVGSLNPLGVGPGQNNVPFTFGLQQNYPNPFNPTTVINYSLEHKCQVDISVFNILGQKVSTLVNQEMDAGAYQAVWDGSDDRGNHVASGIYFYKMNTNDYVETRKMVLMR
jgi:hypothetical protein